MKVLSYHDGYVTNSEVYSIVLKRKENKIHKKHVDYAERNWIDHKVLMYCKRTGQDLLADAPERIKTFLSELDKLNLILSKEEILQFINLKPTEQVDMHFILEDCADRFSEEQIDEILQLVQSLIDNKD